MADAVIDNNGPRLALYRALDKIASERWPPAVPQRAVGDLGLPSRVAAYVDALLARVADPAAPLMSMLAADGEEHPGDTKALQELLSRFAASFTGLDSGVVTAARHGEQAATQLAHAVLSWWLSTLPAIGPAR